MGTPDGRRGSVVPDFTADPPVRVPLTEAELAESLRVRADQAWSLVLEQQPDAAFTVEQANGGNQTVPTLLFTDGSTLTNPSVAQVKDRLATLS